MKKRILWVGECSYKGTGYGTYAYEVLSRLHKTGKYEIFELGTHGDVNQSAARSIPWTVFQNEPKGNDQEENARFNSVECHQYGAWMFDQVCCQVKPHVVLDIRDWYMLAFVEQSPARRFFHWAIMPAVDSAPQHQRFIETYTSADAVFGYTDWAVEVLSKQSNGKINLCGTASPGVDTQVFQPFNRAANRNRLAIEDDAFVVGTVMRNQERKRYPELLAGFARFLKEVPEEVARKSYLYLHCSYPDGGWDIPTLIKRHGLGSRILMTYMCDACGATYPSFFQGARSYCQSCGRFEVRNPHVRRPIDRATLAMLYNSFDVYVQYSDCEGFGMPVAEAAACGINTMAVDHSAMSDVIRKVSGTPIRLLANRVQHGDGGSRAIPDEDDFVGKLLEFSSLPKMVKESRGIRGREGVLQHFDFDKTASVWMNHIDNLDIWEKEELWNSSPAYHRPNTQIPNSLTDESFVRWCISEIAGRPDMAKSMLAAGMASDLSMGSRESFDGRGKSRSRRTLYTREDVAREAMEMCNRWNTWERMRSR